MRIFIAVDVPADAKMALDALVLKFKNRGGRVTWVRAGNLHLTVKFIGEFPREKLGELSSALKDEFEGWSSQEISLGELGGFPNLDKPRVLWVGVNKGKDWFIELVAKVEQACDSRGIPKERKKSHPHLTLGRVRDLKGAEDMLEAFGGTLFEYPPFDVAEITIYESVLTPHGAEYTALKKIPLQGKGQL